MFSFSIPFVHAMDHPSVRCNEFFVRRSDRLYAVEPDHFQVCGLKPPAHESPVIHFLDLTYCNCASDHYRRLTSTSGRLDGLGPD